MRWRLTGGGQEALARMKCTGGGRVPFICSRMEREGEGIARVRRAAHGRAQTARAQSAVRAGSDRGLRGGNAERDFVRTSTLRW
jgi:hypothetical protein